MFERFTRNARAVVIGAQEVAHRHGATEVRPAHLLESLASREGTLATQVLADLGAPADEVRRVVRGFGSQYSGVLDAEDAEALRLLGIDLDDVIRRIDQDLNDGHEPIRKGHKRFSPESKKVLELSLREALQLGDGFIGTEHILLALLRHGDSTALETLKAFDLTVADVRRAVGEADRRAG
jgi:ATP-dependent Clp protease ATP-binding subunit ClpA